MGTTDFTKPTPLIIDVASKIKAGDALDIGAGYGRNSFYLAENGWTVDALDIDEGALNYINTISNDKNLAISTFLQDISTYDSPKEYDMIICLMTLHFMSRKNIGAALDWMKKHTKKHGVVVISGFNDKNEEGARPYLFSSNELVNLFADWTIEHYEGNSLSSMLNEDTKKIDTYHVVRLVAKKTKP